MANVDAARASTRAYKRGGGERDAVIQVDGTEICAMATKGYDGINQDVAPSPIKSP